MKDDLSKIAILKPRYIALIINMMPDTEEEVEALFSKERTNLKKEEIKQIVEIVRNYKK
jgi:DNA-directed RNA polymerase subunit F